MEKRWPHIPRKRLEGHAIKEASNSNITNKVSGREVFKIFLQSPKRIKIDISLKLPLTTTD
jgi:hypothetical protein